MNARIVLLIFDIIIMGISVVLLVSSILMKRTGEIPDLLLDQDSAKKLKKNQEKEAAQEMFPTLLTFSCVCLAAGAVGLIAGLINRGVSEFIFVGALLVFLAAWVWFTLRQKKLKEKYGLL